MDQEATLKLPPGQVASRRLTVMTFGATPQVEKEHFRLQVVGAVANPLELTWEALLELGSLELSADFHCVTRWSKLDVSWAGIPTRALVAAVAPLAEADFVLVHCYGGYTTNIETGDLLLPTSLLAHTLEGQPIPAEHGGPLRLVLPHRYGWKSAKWVSGIEFLTHEVLGFWEQRGYHRRGDFQLEERFSGD